MVPSSPWVGAPLGPAWQATNCQGAAVSEGIQTTVEWWTCGGEWGKRQISVFLSKTLQLTQLRVRGRGGSENKVGALSCRSAETSPGLLTGSRPTPWGSEFPSPLSLQPNSNGSLLWSQAVGPVHPHLSGLEEPKGQKGWTPGSISDDSWVGPWNLALRELPIEICPFLED